MALTRSFRETVVRRARENPAFRAALFEEALQNLVEGETEIALGQIRKVVSATMGFAKLAAGTGIPKTSLMRMLGEHGNPRTANLSAVLKAVARAVDVRLSVHAQPRELKRASLGRKNALFAGNDGGARHWAIAMTLIQTAKLNGVEPMAWLTDVLERIVSGRTKATELNALLPWNWKPSSDLALAAAA